MDRVATDYVRLLAQRPWEALITLTRHALVPNSAKTGEVVWVVGKDAYLG